MLCGGQRAASGDFIHVPGQCAPPPGSPPRLSVSDGSKRGLLTHIVQEGLLALLTCGENAGKNSKNLSTFILTLNLVIVGLMAGWSSAPDTHICASPHVRSLFIPPLIRCDHSATSPPADNSFVLQIANNILKSNNIASPGPPPPSYPLPRY